MLRIVYAKTHASAPSSPGSELESRVTSEAQNGDAFLN